MDHSNEYPFSNLSDEHIIHKFESDLNYDMSDFLDFLIDNNVLSNDITTYEMKHMPYFDLFIKMNRIPTSIKSVLRGYSYQFKSTYIKYMYVTYGSRNTFAQAISDDAYRFVSQTAKNEFITLFRQEYSHLPKYYLDATCLLFDKMKVDSDDGFSGSSD